MCCVNLRCGPSSEVSGDVLHVHLSVSVWVPGWLRQYMMIGCAIPDSYQLARASPRFSHTPTQLRAGVFLSRSPSSFPRRFVPLGVLGVDTDAAKDRISSPGIQFLTTTSWCG